MTDESPARVLEILEEAARRANWDARHGPLHLRTGRFFISPALAGHAWSEPSGALPRRASGRNVFGGREDDDAVLEVK